MKREINLKISDFAIPPSAIFSLPLQQLAGQREVVCTSNCYFSNVCLHNLRYMVYSTYLSKELSDGCLAGLHQSLLGGGGTQDVVRGDTGLAGIDTLAPHGPLPGHINVCIISHDAGAGGVPGYT